MKLLHVLGGLPLVALLTVSAPAQTDWQTVRLEEVEMSMRLIRDKDQIEQLIGDPLDGEFILVEMKIRPFYDVKVELDRADFLLRSRAHNDRSMAQSPSRIAGPTVLALDQSRAGGGGVFTQGQGGPIYGGGPGTNSRPRRVGGNGQTIGNSGASQSEVTLSAETADTETLLDRLRRLELPLEASDQDRSGYLYFQVPAKSKLKHLVFYYDGPYGELEVEFDK